MCTNKWSNIENSSGNLCSRLKNRSNLCVSLSSYIHSSNAHLSLMMVMISVTETIFPCMHLQITVCHNYTCFISAHIHHLNLLLHKYSLCTTMNASRRQHHAHQTLCMGAFTQIFRNKCKKIRVWWIWSHILNPSPFLTLHESLTFTFASCRHLNIDFLLEIHLVFGNRTLLLDWHATNEQKIYKKNNSFENIWKNRFIDEKNVPFQKLL